MPFGSSGLYSSALIYLRQYNTNGNPLEAANSIHSDIVSSSKATLLMWRDMAKLPLLFISLQWTRGGQGRSDAGKRDYTIVYKCFQIAAWYNTDETGTIDLKSDVEIDPAPQGRVKKWWMKTEMMDELLAFPHATGTLCPWHFCFINFVISIHMLLHRHYWELHSRCIRVGLKHNMTTEANRCYWRCTWFIQHSASQRPGVMNMTLAPSERRTDSLAVKQALRSETVLGSRKRDGKGVGLKTLLAASATGIHQCLSRQLPWLGNELVSSVCVLKQGRRTLILPYQGLCWHIPSIVSLLLFNPLPETETEPRKTWKTGLVISVVECSFLWDL